MRRWLITWLLLWAAPAASQPGELTTSIVSFSELDGWNEDDHQQALEAFSSTCHRIRDPKWKSVCALSKTKPHAKQFFELFFKPVFMTNDMKTLFTAYFEPVLAGSSVKTAKYKYPIYKLPKEVKNGSSKPSRRAIEENKILSGRNLEIAWVSDPVELQFLQIQGSGRVKLENGEVIALGFAGDNGHRYRSLGNELVRRGIFSRHVVSRPVIKNWVKKNPVDGHKLLMTNSSYVFFKKLNKKRVKSGPIGALNMPITALRSIAIDPKYTQLGAPVWLQTEGKTPLNRLMVAQDTGSRVKGPQRADIFWGTGEKAGEVARKIRDNGKMYVLVPIQMAYALADGEI